MISIAEILSEKQKLREAEKQYKKQGPKTQKKDYLSKYDRYGQGQKIKHLKKHVDI